MNTPDQHRCAWATAGQRGLRCMCPATQSTSQFCVFHRHAGAVDAAGIVEWSQEATAEDYLERVKGFIYGQPSPGVEAIRETMRKRADRAPIREPGDDEDAFT